MTGNDVLVNDFVEQEESSIRAKCFVLMYDKFVDLRKDESSKWTNEKHSLYLKSIEALFVDQLYNSLDMQTYSSDEISTGKNKPDTCIASGQVYDLMKPIYTPHQKLFLFVSNVRIQLICQFKVLQRGCWSKKCFKREQSHLKDADRPQVSPSNHWIQHFTNGSLKRQTSTSTQDFVTDSRLHQETGCSNTEGTDQNFVEDAMSSRKRVRTSKIAHSTKDQVVPRCTLDATTKIADSYVCSKKKTK
ncbi:putative cold-regulated protein [Helianthus annuus]|nr:putative cold-regulated protein [Helianthus annuus]